MSLVNQAAVESVSTELGATHALWLMVIKYKGNANVRFASLLFAWIPPFVPAMIYSTIVPRQYIMTVGILYDLRTGEEAATFHRVQNHNSNPGAITSSIYDILWQIDSNK
jgi:hypothetical protein